MGLSETLQWWGLKLYGIPPLISGIILFFFAFYLMLWKGGINWLFGPLLIIFGAAPSIGIGLWLWAEATSHGNR